MVMVQLDENKYFTGSYVKIGGIANGTLVDRLPERMDMPTCNKLVEKPLLQQSNVRVLDENGIEKIDENGFPVFEVEEVEVGLIYEWEFDKDKEKQIIEERAADEIRTKREQAFVLVDRYQLPLLFSELTSEQQQQLVAYRKAWLDAPDTKNIPEILEWMV